MIFTPVTWIINLTTRACASEILLGISFISAIVIVGCSTTGSILELIGRPFNYIQRKSAEYINKQQIGGKRIFTGLDKKAR